MKKVFSLVLLFASANAFGFGDPACNPYNPSPPVNCGPPPCAGFGCGAREPEYKDPQDDAEYFSRCQTTQPTGFGRKLTAQVFVTKRGITDGLGRLYFVTKPVDDKNGYYEHTTELGLIDRLKAHRTNTLNTAFGRLENSDEILIYHEPNLFDAEAAPGEKGIYRIELRFKDDRSTGFSFTCRF